MKQRITHYILIGLIACGLFGFPPTSVAGKWEPKALLLRQRWGLGAETVNGKIYAIGGQDDLPAAGKRVAEWTNGQRKRTFQQDDFESLPEWSGERFMLSGEPPIILKRSRR